MISCLFSSPALSGSFVLLVPTPVMTDSAGVHAKRQRNADIRKLFSTTKRATHSASIKSPLAEELGVKLDASPVYLTKDSWYIIAKGWMPPSTASEFEREWSLHPEKRHPLKIFGRVVYEKRWSQSWGVTYSYSGFANVARPVADSPMVQLLIKHANELTQSIQTSGDTEPYNGCLQNWYEPNDAIGLHADDEKVMRHEYPIFSLSWGGMRRFLFRERASIKMTELWLENGDLLVMGGMCQTTHRHEVPKRRVTMDPATSNRINWTIRAFHNPSGDKSRKRKAKSTSDEAS